MRVPSRIRVARAPFGSRYRWAALITILCLSLLLPSISREPLSVSASSSYSTTVLGDSPAAYWRLGEAFGTVMKDASSNGNNGSYSGTIIQGQVGAIMGDGDPAVLFNGGHAVALSSSTLSITGALSVEAWIKWAAAPSGVQIILEKGDGATLTNTAYALGYIPSLGFGLYVYIGSNYNSVVVANPPPAGQWSHVVGTRTASGALALYENGAVVATSSDSGGSLNNVSTNVGVAGTAGSGSAVYPSTAPSTR
jgi:hypothetical protein